MTRREYLVSPHISHEERVTASHRETRTYLRTYSQCILVRYVGYVGYELQQIAIIRLSHFQLCLDVQISSQVETVDGDVQG